MSSLQQAYAEADKQWQALENSETPVFMVGAATCGRAAGAVDVLTRLRETLDQRNVDATVIEAAMDVLPWPEEVSTELPSSVELLGNQEVEGYLSAIERPAPPAPMMRTDLISALRGISLLLHRRPDYRPLRSNW